MTAGAALTLWAFIGLESATVPAEEVVDPERTIPRATLLGTLVTTLIYLVTTVAIMSIVPGAQLAQSSSPFADAASRMVGAAWAAQLVALVAMISAFGCLNGWILLQGRVALAAAEDGLFPAQFARVHPRFGTPVFGLVVSSLLVSVLLLMNYSATLVEQFNFVILLATLTTLVPYAYAAAAQVYLFITDPEGFSGRSLARTTLVATLAFAYAVWAIIGAGTDVIAKGFILLLLGIPVYLYQRWRVEYWEAGEQQSAAGQSSEPDRPRIAERPI